MKRPLVLACLLCALAAPAAAQERKLLPVDEGATDASWVEFRNRLLNALAGRDREFLLSIVDSKVRNSMGAPSGIAEFRTRWEIDSETSPLWRELSSALFLGSAWLKRENDPRVLCAPYVAVRWPDDIDPTLYGAVTAREALLKAQPTADSGTLATLSYDVLRVLDWEVPDSAADTKQKWVKVRVKEVEGFVPEEQVRSSIEHRACFLKGEGGWHMVSLVLGVER